MEDEEVLLGGVGNASRVVRVGGHVLRPANEHSGNIHAFLVSVRAAGFDGVSKPIGIEDGRERLEFIEGDVAVPPFPEWAQSDEALASTTALMARFHEASRSFDPEDLDWNGELADPRGGPIVCHNDVCLENVVFRNGEAIALLDFDFAAPGSPVFDLAQFARMCVPIDDDINAARLGWGSADLPARLRLVTDTYRLDAAARLELLTALDDSIALGGEFVRRRVQAGEPGFVAMWNEMGGMERFVRRRRWWSEHRDGFARALR